MGLDLFSISLVEVAVKRFVCCFVFTFFLFAFSGFALSQEVQNKRIALFTNPQNPAEEVANLVATHAQTRKELYGYDESNNECAGYFVRLHETRLRGAQSIYEIQVSACGSERHLSLDIYFPTRDIGTEPKDIVIEKLIWGEPKLLYEVHVSDNNTDDVVDHYHAYENRKGSRLHGFTHEERDRASGVQDDVFSLGKVWKKKKFWRSGFVKASATELENIQDYYDHYLRSAKDLLQKPQ